MSRLYLAGPMTGIPYHNVPRFKAVAEDLRNKGIDMIVPVEMDGAEWEEQALADETGTGKFGDRTWGDFLSRDVKVVADQCDGVVLLEGWKESRGARLEAFVAVNVGKPVYEYHPGYKCKEYRDLVQCSPIYVLQQISKHAMMERGV